MFQQGHTDELTHFWKLQDPWMPIHVHFGGRKEGLRLQGKVFAQSKALCKTGVYVVGSKSRLLMV